jgi:hypothetical protein
MGRQEDELERIRRIRDEQIATRDPRAKERKFYGDVSRRRKARHFTLKSFIADLQAKWTWMLIGGIVGAIAAIVVIQVFRTQWAEYAGLVIIVFGVVVGRLMGAVRDWGDEDWGRK